MKKLRHALLGAAVLLGGLSAFAENRAVNIDLGTSGGRLDTSALQSVRRVVGNAITAKTVDTFAVYSPRAGGPIPREGGLSACVEAGFASTPAKFSAFVGQLRSIRPRSGTVLKLEPTDRCKPIEVAPTSACGGIAGTACPGAQQYCDVGAGKCRMPDAQGMCQTRPEMCPEIFKPVCGCDGKTYGNACKAAAAGVSVEHEGECRTTQGQACGGITGAPCPQGQACVDNPADTCDPQRGGADCPGICQSR